MRRRLLATICLLSAMVAMADTAIDTAPADTLANEAARKLYAYLKDEVWGKRVMAGCQAEWNYNTNDAQRIYQAAGKYPAVNVFDFQHHDQSWINYRTATALNWQKAGGIVGFMWHIHMPCNVFAEGEEGWGGFYTEAAATGEQKPCYISPKQAATEGTPENKLLLKRLDNVANLMLYYQQQGVAILFRPLHEAAGGWFWWGSEGAEAYKMLYRYMYDYLTQKGIHNLLWIWTSQLNDPDWYPGDEYVDIVARDGYPEGNTSHHAMAADYEHLRKAYPNKMLCLAECNSVPSWESMQESGALWLFVAPWCGGGAFAHGNDNAFWKQLLQQEGVLTRDELKVFE